MAYPYVASGMQLIKIKRYLLLEGIRYVLCAM